MSRAVVVGSGPNGLAAALTLAEAGLEVTVLEAGPTIGGGTRSGELTVPGLLHDFCSAAHPLAVDNAFTRRFDLREHGLTWRWAEVEYAHPLDDGGGAAAVRSVTETAQALGAGEHGWQSLFGPLTDRFDRVTEDFMQPLLRKPSHPLALARFGLSAVMPASRVAGRLHSTEAQALFGGVAAHAFRPLSSPTTAAIGLALGTAAHRYGWPVAQGGSQAITGAMAQMLEQRGGRIVTDVRVRSWAEIGDADVVMLDTSPRAAVEILGPRLPWRISRALQRFRYGPAAFKVDFAVVGGVPWSYEPARRAGTVHLGGTLEEIAAAEQLVARGRMPQAPFVLVCQQYLADPGRSRRHMHPVYAYAHVPAAYSGDATAAIEAQIERFAPGFRDRVVGRHVQTTAELEAANANCVGGDIATGASDPRQLLMRPRFAADPYSLGIDGVYLCSAATPPGAGAHGMCGYNAACAALAKLQGAPAHARAGA